MVSFQSCTECPKKVWNKFFASGSKQFSIKSIHTDFQVGPITSLFWSVVLPDLSNQYFQLFILNAPYASKNRQGVAFKIKVMTTLVIMLVKII